MCSFYVDLSLAWPCKVFANFSQIFSDIFLKYLQCSKDFIYYIDLGLAGVELDPWPRLAREGHQRVHLRPTLLCQGSRIGKGSRKKIFFLMAVGILSSLKFRV